MKKLLTILTILALPCFAHAGGTTTTTQQIQTDAERAAGAFLIEKAVTFTGGFYLDQVTLDGSSNWLGGQFTVIGKKITQLRLSNKDNPDGVEITIPAGGLAGLPRNTVGETRNYSVWLNGYTEDGTFASYGGFSKQLFEDNDNIVIELRPSDRLKKIAFAPDKIPAGVNPNNLTLKYESSTGSSTNTGYNQYLGGFWIYVDPLSDGTYTLYDSSNGFIYPFNPASGGSAVSQYAAINTTYIGGAVEIAFGNQNYADYPMILLDSNTVVKRNESMVPAKVYFTDLQGVYGMSISINNFQGKVEVFEVQANGEQKLVKTADVSPTQIWTNVDVFVGYGPVVITFTGGRSPYFGGSWFRFVRDPNITSPQPRG